MTCGIDEAGRGSIAGGVCAAAVILPPDFPFEILGDSKAISQKKRQYIEEIIKEKSLGWAVGWATHKEIDELNILNATLKAMKEAYLKLKKGFGNIDLVLVDGNIGPKLDTDVKTVIKGDTKVYEIMAASIIAKNSRDRLMVALSPFFPEYGYEKHKGYPTKEHLEYCRLNGLSPIARHSFKIR
ncbi:MAG: ribonuclease HII [Sphaerochaetaceae bacterium]